MSRSAAHRAARVELGNPTVARERVRDAGWESTVETLLADLRYGARRLRSNPGLHRRQRDHAGARHRRDDGHLQRGQPDPVRAAALSARRPRAHGLGRRPTTGRPMTVTFGTYREISAAQPLVRRDRAVQGVAADDRGRRRTRTARRTAVSADYFRALGVAPDRGRDFTTSDDRDGGPRVVILSDALWRRRFGGDPADRRSQSHARRRSVSRDRRDAAALRERSGADADIWTPLQYDGVHARTRGSGAITCAGRPAALRRRSRGGAGRSRPRSRGRRAPRCLAFRGRRSRPGSSSRRCRTTSRVTSGRRCWRCSRPCSWCSSSPASTSPTCCSRAAHSGAASSRCAPRSAPAARVWSGSCSPRA